MRVEPDLVYEFKSCVCKRYTAQHMVVDAVLNVVRATEVAK